MIIEALALISNAISIAMSALQLKSRDGQTKKSENANTASYLPPAIAHRVAQFEISITKQPCECFDTASRYMRSAIEEYRRGEWTAGDVDSDLALRYAYGLRPCFHEADHLRRQGSGT